METWKDIKGFEGEYQMSEDRKIKRLSYTVTQIGYGGKKYTRTVKEKIINQSIDNEGYYYACLNGRKYRTHWLYYNTFIGDSTGMIIDHIDRNRLNNDPSNLRLVSPKESIHNRTLPYRPDIQDMSKYQKYKNKSNSHPFQLRFTDNGKRISIGYFKTYEEAENKYRELYNERQKRIDASI